MTRTEVQPGAFIETSPGAPCPNDYICFYQDVDLQGNSLQVPKDLPVPDLTKIPVNPSRPSEGNWNDRMSSWHNNSNARFCWYFDINFKGECHPMEPGIIVHRVLPRENDQASSLHPCNRC